MLGPLRTSQVCLNRGEATGEVHACHACATRMDVPEFACSLHERCTESKLIAGVPCCGICPDREVFATTSRIRIPLNGMHFNSSIIRFRDRNLVASRNGWTKSRIMLHEISDWRSPRVFRSHYLDTAMPASGVGSEDPRLFVFRDQLHVAYTAYDGKVADMAIARIGSDLQVEDLWCPRLARRNKWEKNWSFFESGGELYSIYSNNPMRVLRHDRRNAHEFCVNTQAVTYSGGEIRGGAAPVRVGKEFYHFFHGYMRRNNCLTYSVGVYTFSADPPFRITRFCPDPIMLAEGNIHADKSVIYPCGAILDNGEWIVSYGLGDQDSRLGFADADDIERVLRPVAAGTTAYSEEPAWQI